MFTLALRLSGPVQRWGSISFPTSQGDTIKETWPRPSYSGVLGLIRSALGLSRTEETGLSLSAEILGKQYAPAVLDNLRPIGFSVRVEEAGFRSYDTHTSVLETAFSKKLDGPLNNRNVGKNNKLQEIQTLDAAVFTVILGFATNEARDAVTDALQAPVFAPYLGLRAFPPGELHVLGTGESEREDMLDFFLSLPLRWDTENRVDVFYSSATGLPVEDVPRQVDVTRIAYTTRNVAQTVSPAYRVAELAETSVKG